MRAWWLIAVASCTSARAPAIANVSEPKPASVILLATDGFAAPIACTGAPKLEGGEACAKQLPAQPQLRSAAGTSVTTFGWNPDRRTCPWEAEPIATRGLLRLCPEADEECALPEQLLVWPPTSTASIGTLAPIDPTDPRLASDVAVVAKHEAGPLQVAQAFAIDLNGDGELDRIVLVRRPRPKPHPTDLADPQWTVVALAHGDAHVLADAACSGSGHELVGVIDLDGTRAVVMKFQYQIVIYKLDGTILVEGPGCCGLG